jgi:hypothetical protein
MMQFRELTEEGSAIQAELNQLDYEQESVSTRADTTGHAVSVNHG